jgi:L-asparagine transporter-like permease
MSHLPPSTTQQHERDSRSASQDLQRRLTERQVAMIAIGGAIGVGLFLGSNVTISQAGPAVLLTYVLGAAVSLVVAYSLAEMAVIHPVAGAFGIYAEKYLNPWFGFTVRATYGLIQIVAIGAEVTAVAIYFQYWFQIRRNGSGLLWCPVESLLSMPHRSGILVSLNTGSL